MNKLPQIHIVSFDIPFPANYGGIIDVFFKIKALNQQGIKIQLHCFEYNHERTSELNKYCEQVFYYKRPKSLRYFFSKLPFIVATRSNIQLYNNLIQDTNPILFEGLHTCYFLKKIQNYKKRQIIVRSHNIEHEYYWALAKKEQNILRKIFFYTEARKLKKYESILTEDIQIAGITKKDCLYLNQLNPNNFLLPAFHPFNKIDIKTGCGKYILFHGNLSVNENIEAALFIIQRIASKINHEFIIAGRNPHKTILQKASLYHNVKIVANPDDTNMYELIQNAHINLLTTSQTTGIKLKLINALHIGRYCIANNKMVQGSNLESLCIIKNTAKEIIVAIKKTIDKPFSGENISNRKDTLLKFVNNTENAKKLINLLNKTNKS
ncbi:MAG: glycosyltransferase [Bacteroidales bacterium]|nr:glycosyltransferase [Bacteroidales bacterium]